MFVITINSAGMHTTSCTSSRLASEKCVRMTSSAGATAAPAITVKSESDNMLAASGFNLISLFLKKLPPFLEAH